jgi:iron complex outermembrane receptor protein
MSAYIAFGQKSEVNDSTWVELESVEIIQKLPITTEKITKNQLQQKNLGQDMASLLQNATSVVSTSDAGAGIGYSSIRIRGVAQDHINITLNGIPLNDSESQNVFWVNMPDLASSLNSVSIQRGVGTSTSGSGAFGAIINMDLSNPSTESFLESANSWGSFATQKYTLQGGTGRILNDKLRVDFNASLLKSDGYIDRASADLFSVGMNAKYDLNANTSFRYWTFFGKEKTYQAWNGIDEKTLKNNRKFNPAGAIYNDDWSEVIGFYDDETDNYRQHHNHLVWDQRYGKGWKSNSTLFYTRGKGFYDNYKQDSKLVKFKIDAPFDRADLVRQKWLDNHFYGLNYNIENQNLGNLKFFSGFSISQYHNEHYGLVTWVKGLENHNSDHEFYRNKSKKNDVSVYAKALYELNQFELFGDLQYRFVNYTTQDAPGGENEYEKFFAFEDEFNFFNPKFGINFNANSTHQLYFYYGMAHREPIRSDYIDSGQKLNPEKLHDFELGYKKSGNFSFNFNLFYMYYLDQLVATGELNETGNYIRRNSGKSYRSGIEIQTLYTLIPQKFNVYGNVTYSINKNIDYTEIGWNENGEEVLNKFGDTDISFSPNWIASFGLQFQPIKNIAINLNNKYVGEQFLTNTELKDGRLSDYFLTDVVLSYQPKWWNLKNLEFSLLVNNLLDRTYESNGFYYEGAYYYPQAGINILGGFRVRL